MGVWHGMDISERYGVRDDSGDGAKVGAFRRDIGNNTYQFVYVKNGDNPALITVSKVVLEPVKSIRFGSIYQRRNEISDRFSPR